MGHPQPHPYTHNTVDNRSTLLHQNDARIKQNQTLPTEHQSTTQCRVMWNTSRNQTSVNTNLIMVLITPITYSSAHLHKNIYIGIIWWFSFDVILYSQKIGNCVKEIDKSFVWAICSFKVSRKCNFKKVFASFEKIPFLNSLLAVCFTSCNTTKILVLLEFHKPLLNI